MQQSRLQYLLERFKAGLCTPQERLELMELISQPEMEPALKELIDQEAELVDAGVLPIDKELDGRKADALFHKIVALPSEAKVVALQDYQPKRRGWLAAAAVILLIATTAAFYWIRPGGLKQAEAVQAQPVVQDLPPGSNGAVLTLADGSLVVLDSAGEGLVAAQGTVSLEKRSDGQLVYTAEGAPLETLYNTLSTPRGRQFRITLPDGTEAWLNAASSLHYPVAFTGKERRVVVTGEAYFEVARDPGKPFVVEARGQEAVVLGTHFNINAYEDEGVVRTTLLEGSLRVSNAQGQALLRPGQASDVRSARQEPQVHAADVQKAVAWKNGYFSFHNADLKAVIRQLSRWYDVDVRFEGDPGQQQFNGEIGRDLTLKEVLDGLAFTNVHVSLEEGKLLVIRP